MERKDIDNNETPPKAIKKMVILTFNKFKDIKFSKTFNGQIIKMLLDLIRKHKLYKSN